MQLRTILLGVLSFTPLAAVADESIFNMTRGVTPISHDIYDLHMTIFWISVAIGVAVFGVMIYAMIRHRHSRGHQPDSFHGNTLIELIWTIIPFLILIGMAIPATKVLIRMEDDQSPDINIQVIGFQWKWKYDYLDYGISYFSNLSTPREQLANLQPKGQWYLLEVDKPLVVPIHKKIRFLVTSNDVIHSWWVPALGIKRDAIPGFIHEAWARIEKPGIYRGQCAELCGMNHGFMPIVVIAKTEAGFQQWINEQTKTAATMPMQKRNLSKSELMKTGNTVYEAHCAVCHKSDGKGTPPVFPAIVGSKISTGPAGAHINIVLHGKTGTAMQAFKDQLSIEEIAAVITYERNAWGNNNKNKYGKDAGGLIQPSAVATAEKGNP